MHFSRFFEKKYLAQAMLLLVLSTFAGAFTIQYAPSTTENGLIIEYNWTTVNFTASPANESVAFFGVDWNGTNLSTQNLSLWKFESATDAIVFDRFNASRGIWLGGNTTDNATKAPSIAASNSGNGLLFDGANDLAVVANASDFLAGGNFTISAWAKLASAFSANSVHGYQPIATGQGYELGFDPASGSAQFILLNSSFTNASAHAQNISDANCSTGDAVLGGAPYSIEPLGEGFAALVPVSASCTAENGTHQAWLLAANGTWSYGANATLDITGLRAAKSFGGKAYYAATNESTNAGLFEFNGTAISNVSDAVLAPCGDGLDLEQLGGNLYYLCNETDTANNLLFAFNSTNWTLVANATVENGSFEDLFAFNGTLYAIAANDTVRKAYAFNGTNLTFQFDFTAINSSGSSQSAFEYNQQIFLAGSPQFGERVEWNGTEALNTTRDGVGNSTNFARAPVLSFGGELVSVFANSTGNASIVAAYNASAWRILHESAELDAAVSSPQAAFLLNGTLCYGASAAFGAGRIAQVVFLPGFAAQVRSNITKSFAAGAWNNLLAAFDNSTATLFVNGSLEGSADAQNFGQPATTYFSLRLGADATGNRLNGSVDEFGLYSRALGAPEAALFAGAFISGNFMNISAQPGNYSYFAWMSNGTGTNSTASRIIVLGGVPDSDLPGNFSFVYPSDANAASNYTGYTYINVTIEDGSSPIDSCKLEWAGTNETMNISRANNFSFCYTNKTFATTGNHTYYIWANDTQRNMNRSFARYYNRAVVVVTGNTGCSGCGGGGSSSGYYVAPTGTLVKANKSASTPTASPSNVTNFSAPDNDTLETSKERMAATVKAGEETKLELVAFNRQEGKESNITVNVSDQIRDMVNFTGNLTNIGANRSTPIGFTIIVPEDKAAGKYYGMITLSDGKNTVSVPLTITVEPKAERLLQITVTPLSERVKAGGELRLGIDIVNLGTKEQTVGLRLLLVDTYTDRVAAAIEENITVDTSLKAIKAIIIPEKARAGKYLIKAVAFSVANETRVLESSDSAEIIVEAGAAQSIFEGIAIPLLVTLAFIALAGFLAYKKFDDSRRRRFLSDLDFASLPTADSGSGYIGKVAETYKPAFLNLDKLCTHALVAGTTGSGKTVGAQVIVEEALKKGVAVVVIDPTGQWSGFLRPQKSEAMLKLYSRFEMKRGDATAFNGRIRVVRDGAEKFNPKQYMRPGEVTVIALNELSPSTGGADNAVSRELEEFVAKAFESVFDANLDESQRLRMLIVCDEVHRLLPKFGASGRAFNEIERGVREFRKWGVGVVLVSQVTADFIGEIKANIGTEIQFRSKNDNDLERIAVKFGSHFSQGVTRAKVGVGLMQNPDYNKGRPYFVEFRPLLHSLTRLTDAELAAIREYDAKLSAISEKIDKYRAAGADVTEAEVELDLAAAKTQLGHFDVVRVYLESLQTKIADLEKKYGN